MKPVRRLRRFFSTQALPLAGGEVWLPSSETHHIRNILRLKPGDSCLVADGAGAEAEAKVKSFSEDGRTLLTVMKRKASAEVSSNGLEIRICQAMLQKGKMDGLVEKAQELGVQEIWPVETSRTVVKMSGESSERVLARWEKIAREAAKQSGSLELVKISEPQKLDKVLAQIPDGEKVAIFHPDAKAENFREWVECLIPPPLSSPHEMGGGKQGGNTIYLFLGPEGGFSDQEVEKMLKKKSAALVSLGKNILKADTAFLAVISALRLMNI